MFYYHLSCYKTYICNNFTNERKSSTQSIDWPRDIHPDLRLHKKASLNTQSYNGIAVINEYAGVFDNQDKYLNVMLEQEIAFKLLKVHL